MTAAKKIINVTIDMGEIIYDIMNETYLRGRTLQNEQNYKEVASMYASLDEENRFKIMRSIKRAYSEVKGASSEYLSEAVNDVDNGQIDDDDLKLTFEMPSNYNEAAASSIAESIHAYIVNATVSDWYIVTNTQDAAGYEAMATGSLEQVKMALSRRSRPTRKPTVPRPPKPEPDATPPASDSGDEGPEESSGEGDNNG